MFGVPLYWTLLAPAPDWSFGGSMTSRWPEVIAAMSPLLAGKYGKIVPSGVGAGTGSNDEVRPLAFRLEHSSHCSPVTMPPASMDGARLGQSCTSVVSVSVLSAGT